MCIITMASTINVLVNIHTCMHSCMHKGKHTHMLSLSHTHTHTPHTEKITQIRFTDQLHPYGHLKNTNLFT